MDDDAVAQDADAVGAEDLAVEDVQAGHDVAVRQAEGLADFGVPAGDILELGLQQTGHRRLDLVEQRVDDVVEADVDARLSAARRAAASGRTLKPMMIAPEAAARMTSDSVIAPMPEWTIADVDLSSSSCRRSSEPWIAPSEPCTSALRIRRSSFCLAVRLGGCRSLQRADRRSITLGTRLARALLGELARLALSATTSSVASLGRLEQAQDLGRGGRPGACGRAGPGRRSSPSRGRRSWPTTT